VQREQGEGKFKMRKKNNGKGKIIGRGLSLKKSREPKEYKGALKEKDARRAKLVRGSWVVFRNEEKMGKSGRKSNNGKPGGKEDYTW